MKSPPPEIDDYAPQTGGLAARAAASAGRPRYLDALNPEQRAAVETLDGPVLVLAGAGTGKTRALTTRIGHILALGKARAYEILAVTFTNKAAREMRQRVEALVGEGAQAMQWLGTFHAISAKILRRHAELVGLKPNFTILDVDDQIRLLKQVLRAENIDDKRWPARALAMRIDGWKNRGLTPAQVPAGDAESFANGKGAALYALYQERLKVLNAVDFGDLLMESLRLFRDNPDVLADYQRRFKYILVDEYQDTNIAQYLWLRLISQRAPGKQNVCCVGDDDQSVYGWRGAEVENILRFEQDFPGAKVVRLERNYRSTGHILAAASHLISHNEGRLGKTLFTDGGEGEKPTLTGVWDSQEEARSIGEDIEQLSRKDHSLEEIAILVRASFQMREFEERFVEIGLPYRVIGGPRFYERLEIRDALAYLRCVAQPADDLAFERIINTPKRGLGDATLQMLHEYARREAIPLMQAARVLVESEELKPKPRGALRGLIGDFDRWRTLIDSKPQHELAEQVLDESGYTEMWRSDKTPEATGRLDNLKELVRAMEAFPDLESFLEHVSLVMEADSAVDQERVSIMTLHGAKGLEFETVYLPGWEEGLFPEPAHARRTGTRRPRGRAPPRLCRADARQAPRQDLFRQQPAHSRAVAGDRAVALHRQSADGQCRGGRGAERLAIWLLWRLALRQSRRLRLRLFDAGMEARAGDAKRLRARRRGARVARRTRQAAGDDRGRSDRALIRRFALFSGRAGVSLEVRARLGGGGRRQQAHGRFRQGRQEDGAGEFCAGGVRTTIVG